MAAQIIMDHSGDTRHDFDVKDEKALLEAEERFKPLTGTGFTAATKNRAGVRRFVPARGIKVPVLASFLS